MSRGNGKAQATGASDTAAARIVEELARRRMTRQQLAVLAKISLSTLEKALSGRRTLTVATLVRLEEALGVNLRQNQPEPAAQPAIPLGLAPATLGSYSRPAVSWMEGDYLTLRPSFSEPAAIYAYLTQIRWDEVVSNLVFSEAERIDAEYTQGGVVSAPHYSGHIYLVTNKHGQYRLVIVSRPTIRGELHGILATLQVGRGAQLTPVATPIVFLPLQTIPKAEFGVIRSGHQRHTQYRNLLKRTVEEPFALLIKGH
jgi:transcriptional regulator with XRE-family HTH domain